MTFWVGTSGFSYKEWKGSFYPEDLPNDQMLSYYGERLNAVEINNTFYRMPSRKVFDRLVREGCQTPSRSCSRPPARSRTIRGSRRPRTSSATSWTSRRSSAGGGDPSSFSFHRI